MKKRAFARYTKKGQLVSGSLVVTTNGGYPDKTSLWREVPVWYNDVTDCPTPDYGEWKLVTGGAAGDGVVLRDDPNNTNEFTFVGPNDNADEGWVYLTKYFTEPTTLQIEYDWTSFDDNSGGPPQVDWPVLGIWPTEPTGIPGDLTVRVNNTPSSGTWFIPVNVSIVEPAWFYIGIYSDDSCCGRGFLSININTITPSPEIFLITTLQADYDDATGNTPGAPLVGPDGNTYYAFDGFVYNNAGGAGTLPYTNAPICYPYPPFVFYFKNNAYVLVDRPGTIVPTGTPC